MSTKISLLPAAAAFAATDIVPMDPAGGAPTQSVTAALMKTFMSASPTLVTPTLGVATATSINKLTITAPATGSTLTIQDGFTLTVSGSATIASTPPTLGANTFTSTQTIAAATNVNAVVVKANAAQLLTTPLLLFQTSAGAETGRITFDNIAALPGSSIFIGKGSGTAVDSSAAAPSGRYNTCLGFRSMQSVTTGYYNTAIGTDSMAGGMTTAFKNVGVGANTLGGLTTGDSNVAVGFAALNAVTTHTSNTAFGTNALTNCNADNNCAFGSLAGNNVTSGNYNTVFGSGSGSGINTASLNVCVGINAGSVITVGSSNTFLGSSTDAGSNALTKAIAIGANAIVAASNSAVIGGAAGADNVKLGINMTTPAAWLHLPAGAAAAGNAPLKFTSGTNNTTAEAGAMEYNGTNLFFTRAGTTREGVITQSAVTTEVIVSDTSVTVNIGGATYKLLARA